jgi:thioredoxin 1
MIYWGGIDIMNTIADVGPDDQTYKQHEWAILLFESPWCGSCKELLRSLEKLSLASDIDCFFGKVDITQNQALAQAYTVMSLPTVVILQKGAQKERFSGGISEEKFMQKVKGCIEKDVKNV